MQQIQLSPANYKIIQKTKENPDVNLKNPNTIIQTQDKFEVQSPKTNEPKLNTYAVAPKSNFNFNKKHAIMFLSATVAISCVVGLIVSGKYSAKTEKLQKALSQAQESTESINSLNQKLLEKDAQLQDNIDAIKKLNEVIDSLKARLNLLSCDDKNFEKLRNDRINYYQEIANNAKLEYDPLTPPNKELQIFSYFRKKFPFIDTSSTIKSKNPHTYTQELLNQLKQTGNIEIPSSKKITNLEKIKQAMLDTTDSTFADSIGKSQPAGIKLEYGARANWSNEKIARDIMQNFFDANNHSLDGVGISINKAENSDKFKIKISGNGVYDCNSLLELGSGNKLQESPYNAGGFGEGSRMVVASLLGQNKTSCVDFASADWKIDFHPSGKSINRKIEKTSSVLDGNYIEFETADESFVQSLIKSVNFFDNSKNPDFQNLTFENQNFGFKVLKPKEKGNFYLTQRFEYKDAGAWEDNVEGLNLIFKRKPDFKKYKEITGKEFNIGRDRLPLNCDDVYDLTKYFVSDLSDEELINAILSTKIQWRTVSTKEKSAIKSFINALCDTIYQRDIVIDFNDTKICKSTPGTNEAIWNFIRGLGYDIVSDDLNLDKIGMPTTKEIMEKASNHKPLNPTPIEIKKLRLLEEAIKSIQQALEETYDKKLKFIFNDIKNSIKIKNTHLYGPIMGILYKTDKDSEIIQKYYYSDWAKINPDEFTQDVINYLEKRILKITPETLEKNQDVFDILTSILENSKNENEVFKQYATQIANLNIISKHDVNQPRYIFDRKNEMSKSTLGEAIIDNKNFKRVYMGHWIDKTYLNNGNFYDLLATWLHEISHKSGGDGTAEFTYKLTDVIEALANASINSSELRINLSAIEKVFNNLN